MPFEAPEQLPPPPRRRSRKEAQVIRIPKREDAPGVSAIKAKLQADTAPIELTDADVLSEEEVRRAHDEAESDALVARLAEPRTEEPASAMFAEPKIPKRKKSAASDEAAELAALRAEFKAERRGIAAQAKEKPERKAPKKERISTKAPAKKPFEEMGADERMALSPDELLAMAEEAPPAPRLTPWIDARLQEMEAKKIRQESEKAERKARRESMKRFTEQETEWMNEGQKMSKANEQAHAEMEARYGGKPPKTEIVTPGGSEAHIDWVAELGSGIDMDQYGRLVRRQVNLDDMLANKLGSWWGRQKAKFELWAIARELEAFEQEIDTELSVRRDERLAKGESVMNGRQIRQMIEREARKGSTGRSREGRVGNLGF